MDLSDDLVEIIKVTNRAHTPAGIPVFIFLLYHFAPIELNDNLEGETILNHAEIIFSYGLLEKFGKVFPEFNAWQFTLS